MFSRPFILRPRLAVVVNLLIALAGLIALNNLPVEEYPDIAPPSISISATYSGASADVVQQTVGMPIEDEINGVEDLLYFSSTSSNDGSYSCSVTFKTGTNTDIALVNLQNAVKRAEAQLPSEVTRTGIRVEKRGTDNLGMVAFLTDGSVLNSSELVNYVNNTLKDALARVDGISSVELLSNREYAMRIWLDPIRLTGLGLSAADVKNAIEAQNLSGAAGSVGTEGSNNLITYKLNVTGRLKTAEQFENIIVRSDPENGRIVHLKDVARVELGSRSYAGSELLNGQESVGLGLFRAPDANALRTMDSVKAELERRKPNFPKGVSYAFGYDPTEFIVVSMNELVITLGFALVLVIGVTWCFLGTWRATIIPAAAIPISLLGTFAVLWCLDFSINTLTMFGIILVIGSLVDDAIVVVENTQRWLEEGLSPLSAAFASMKEITSAVIATTLVTVACYAPLLFYSGMVGEIYRQFAASMCIALCISTIVALTLSPALCALLLRQKLDTQSRLAQRWESLLFRLRDSYGRIVERLLHKPVFGTACFFALLAGIALLYQVVPQSLIPQEDKGSIMVNLELPSGASQNRTFAAMNAVRERIESIPGVRSTMTMSGRSMMSGSGENAAMCIVQLDSWDSRTTPDRSIDAIMTAIREKTEDIAAVAVTPFVPPAMMGLGAMGGISFELCSTTGADAETLARDASEFSRKLEESSLVRSAMTSFRANTTQLRFVLDRDKAQMLGVTPETVYTALQNGLASYYVNDFTLENNNFEVIVQAEAGHRTQPSDVTSIQVINAQGRPVPLSAIGDISIEIGATELSRFNKMSSASINVQSASGSNAGSVYSWIETVALPEHYAIEWTGLSRQEKDNDGEIIIFTGLALLFAYLFLVAQYESWILPIPVMLSVSFALFGGLAGLRIAGKDLDIYAQLGLIMLIGLAAKSAILMVEFIKTKVDDGLPILEAATTGAKQRWRAVMMTAWSFIVGVLPMVFATGAGSSARQSIGITTFSGMLCATLIGILFTPFFFFIVESFWQRFSTKNVGKT